MGRTCITLGFILILGCQEGSGMLFQGAAAEGSIASLDQAIRDLGCDNVIMCLAAQPGGVDADTLTYLRMKRGARVVAVVAGWGGSCARRDECAGLSSVPLGDRAREVMSAADAQGWELHSLNMTETGFEQEAATRRLVQLIREIQPDTILTRHSKDQDCAFARSMRLAGEEAFWLAAGVDVFPDQIEAGLHPWQVSGFLERTRCPSNPVWEYDVTIPVGEWDRIRGMTYSDIAAAIWPLCVGCAPAARSLGADGLAYYRLVLPASGTEEAASLFVDRGTATILQDCYRGWKARRSIRRWASAVRWLQEVSREDRGELLKGLRKADRALWDLERIGEGQPEAAPSALKRGINMADLQRKLHQAAALTLGLETRILECPEKVWPGTEFEVAVSTRLHGEVPIWDVRVDPLLAEGMEFVSVSAREEFLAQREHSQIPGQGFVRPAIEVEELSPGRVVTGVYRFRIPGDVQFDEANRQTPCSFREGLFPIHTTFCLDRKRGLVHRVETPVLVTAVPRVTVEAVPETPLFIYGEEREMMVQVRVTNHTDRRWPRTLVALHGPDGFSISRQEIPRVTLLPFETASVAFWVLPKLAKPGVHVFRAMVIYGLEEGQTYGEVDREQLANAVVEMPIALAAVEPPTEVKVGLIRTCGDVLENALESLGVPYSVLEADELAAADLGQWDVIIVDSGAYSKRPDVVRHYKRLLRYIWRGGHVVVMGHHPDGWDSKYAPFPIELTARPIQGEEMSVAFLAPDHPLVRMPNQLELADFEGWEGPWGRCFPSSWSETYSSLLSVQARGLPEGFAGGYLLAKYGYGSYIYTGYDWEQQLEGSHPGAYRVFANMVAYPRYREDTAREETSPEPESVDQ